jgi:hypothetical protein
MLVHRCRGYSDHYSNRLSLNDRCLVRVNMGAIRIMTPRRDVRFRSREGARGKLVKLAARVSHATCAYCIQHIIGHSRHL